MLMSIAYAAHQVWSFCIIGINTISVIAVLMFVDCPKIQCCHATKNYTCLYGHVHSETVRLAMWSAGYYWKWFPLKGTGLYNNQWDGLHLGMESGHDPDLDDLMNNN